MKIEKEDNLLYLCSNMIYLWFFRVASRVEEELEALFGMIENFIQLSTTFIKII